MQEHWWIQLSGDNASTKCCYWVLLLSQERTQHLCVRRWEGPGEPAGSRSAGQARTSQAAGVTDGHIAFRGSISPRFRGCNSRKVVSGPCFASVSRRMCASIRASPHRTFADFPPWPPSPLPPILLTRLFSFPLISVRCSRLFIAGVHTISRRTLTAPTTSNSVGNYRIIAEKLLGPLEGTARPSVADLCRGNEGTEGKRRERDAWIFRYDYLRCSDS